MKRRLPSVLFTAGLALVACRGGGGTSDDTPGDDNPPQDGSGNPGGMTIKDVQSDSMPPGTAVTLKSVVVTAIDTFGSRTGAFWVEDQDGGEFSGVQVFNADTASVAALAVGDLVDISGAQKSEFALSSDTSGLTDTELEPVSGGQMTVTKVGNGTVPDPLVVDALSIGQLGSDDRNAELEKYEGVLITVNHVSALQNARSFGSAADQDSFTVTGTINVESSLAAFPGAGSNSAGSIARGDCLDSVTGVLDYFFTYNLEPRSTDEIATGGTGCPAIEQSNITDIGTCGDGVDNDGNGFSDCNDLGCSVGANAWLDPDNCDHSVEGGCGCSTNEPAGNGAAAVSAQTLTGPVLLNNLVIVATASKEYWVQDALQGQAGHGTVVFGPPPAGAQIGQTVSTVQGISGPFLASNSPAGAVAINEVSNATSGTASGAGVPLALSATAAQISNVQNGGTFTGVLVQLKNIKVVTAPVNNKGKMTVTDGTTQFTVGDFAFGGTGAGTYGTMTNAATTDVGTCYATLIGVMDMDTKNQVRTLNPRSKLDMITGGTCQ